MTVETLRAPKLSQRMHQWFETEGTGNRILSMEGLRGLAIVLVFLCHFQIVVLERLAGGFHSKVFLVLAQIGGTGVDLFFLLSGMLIYRAAMKPKLDFGRFLLRRVQRIYPTFLLVLALYFVLSTFLHVGVHEEVFGFRAKMLYLLENIFLAPGIMDVPPIISAAWSLSYEFCFYLFIPLLVRLLKLRSWSARSRASFWAVTIAVYLSAVFLKPDLFPQYKHFDGTFIRFTLFLAGMIIEEVLSTEKGRLLLSVRMEQSLIGSALIALGLLIASEWRTVDTSSHDGPLHAATRAFLVIAIYTALALTSLKQNGLLTRLFSQTSLRWTGNISYSFYLIHGFTLNLIAILVVHLPWAKRHPVGVSPLLFLLAVGITFVTAAVLFLAVEKPFSLRAPAKVKV